MKLKNKKTGEVLEMERSSSVIKDKFRIYDVYKNKFYTYSSLAELNEEWEDYEEPKEYWFISDRGEIFHTEDNMSIDEKRKFFGNYFDTREEAEKAVEKLKAVKRLKDKGFRFVEGWLDNNDDFIIKAKLVHVGLIDQSDVNLLFGGEE